MIKKFVLASISVYQVFSPIRGHCRYYPTCSMYAKEVVQKYGVMKGSWLTLLRLLSCQPFQVQSAKFKVQSFQKRIKFLTLNF